MTTAARWIFLLHVTDSAGAARSLKHGVRGPEVRVPLTATIDELAKELGPLTVAHANAGILVQATSITDLDLDEWNRVLAVDLTGVMLTFRWTRRQAPSVKWATQLVSKARHGQLDRVALDRAGDAHGAGVGLGQRVDLVVGAVGVVVVEEQPAHAGGLGQT
jgi:NAD(P)-dependent dehydrogenase (short-subunit alcohol dehydrogenase family)